MTTAHPIQAAQSALKGLRADFQKFAAQVREVAKPHKTELKAARAGLITIFALAVAFAGANTARFYSTNPEDMANDGAYNTKIYAGLTPSAGEQASHAIIEKKTDAVVWPEAALSELGGIGLGLLYYRRKKKSLAETAAPAA